MFPNRRKIQNAIRSKMPTSLWHNISFSTSTQSYQYLEGSESGQAVTLGVEGEPVEDLPAEEAPPLWPSLNEAMKAEAQHAHRVLLNAIKAILPPSFQTPPSLPLARCVLLARANPEASPGETDPSEVGGCKICLLLQVGNPPPANQHPHWPVQCWVQGKKRNTWGNWQLLWHSAYFLFVISTHKQSRTYMNSKWHLPSFRVGN